MKNSPLAGILLGVLTISALASVVMCWLHIKASRELRMWQTQLGMVQNNRNVVSGLVAESLEYSKKNPSINPILESFGKPKTNTSLPARTGNQ